MITTKKYIHNIEWNIQKNSFNFHLFIKKKIIPLLKIENKKISLNRKFFF